MCSAVQQQRTASRVVGAPSASRNAPFLQALKNKPSWIAVVVRAVCSVSVCHKVVIVVVKTPIAVFLQMLKSRVARAHTAITQAFRACLDSGDYTQIANCLSVASSIVSVSRDPCVLRGVY